jgi:hypothetical protein
VPNERFKAVNTHISNIRMALSGTYHAINSCKYAYRYLAEVQFRFNRRYRLRVILAGLFGALVTLPRSGAGKSAQLRSRHSYTLASAVLGWHRGPNTYDNAVSSGLPTLSW